MQEKLENAINFPKQFQVERMGIWIGDAIECDIRPKKKRDVISFQNNKILKKRKKIIVKIKFRFSDHEYSKKL